MNSDFDDKVLLSVEVIRPFSFFDSSENSLIAPENAILRKILKIHMRASTTARSSPHGLNLFIYDSSNCPPQLLEN